jgi:hypothetical protein
MYSMQRAGNVSALCLLSAAAGIYIGFMYSIVHAFMYTPHVWWLELLTTQQGVFG